MSAQILVYRELISVWLIYKSYCGGHEVQVEVVEVILLHIILYITYIYLAQTCNFHHQA